VSVSQHFQWQSPSQKERDTTSVYYILGVEKEEEKERKKVGSPRPIFSLLLSGFFPAKLSFGVVKRAASGYLHRLFKIPQSRFSKKLANLEFW
jgi:hypothetical protein